MLVLNSMGDRHCDSQARLHGGGALAGERPLEQHAQALRGAHDADQRRQLQLSNNISQLKSLQSRAGDKMQQHSGAHWQHWQLSAVRNVNGTESLA